MNLTLVTEYSPCAECHRSGLVRVTFRRGNVVVLCGTHSNELVDALGMAT